jgi:hypothetical protein
MSRVHVDEPPGRHVEHGIEEGRVETGDVAIVFGRAMKKPVRPSKDCRTASSSPASEASDARIADTSRAAAMPWPTTSAITSPQRPSPSEMKS